jgi:hypothetical protein
MYRCHFFQTQLIFSQPDNFYQSYHSETIKLQRQTLLRALAFDAAEIFQIKNILSAQFIDNSPNIIPFELLTGLQELNQLQDKRKQKLLMPIHIVDHTELFVYSETANFIEQLV